MNTRKISKIAKLLPLAAIALATCSSFAAPVQGPADESFFNYPEQELTGTHGDLISYRTTTVKVAGAPANKAWNVVYQFKDSLDGDYAVSGTVITPTAAWTGTGPRPVVLYAVGTHGLKSSCAPSRQLAAGTDYEASNIAAALNAGYSVMITDYFGALNAADPLPSTYLAGKSQGQALLDIFKAATQIPGANISASSPVAVWGYSQGGQTAAFAGELASTYAPNIKLVGVAAGGVPGDFFATARNLNASTGFAFLASAIVGLNTQYGDEVPIDLIASDAGKAELEKLKNMCVFEALFTYQNKDIKSFTRSGEPLDALLNVASVKNVLQQQALGTRKINVPLYQFHGQADEFIPLGQAVDLKKAYCAKGTNVKFDLFPSEHIVTQFQGAKTVMPWLADRFAGKAQAGNCSNTAAAPASTANPGGGDFVVTLNKWNLTGEIGLKTLAQTVYLPAGSTFTADANVTSKSLNGSLSIPDYKTTIKLIGINTSVGLRVTAAGATTGSNVVGNDGSLTITGQSPANITVTSVLGIPFGECKTVSPVIFGLNFKSGVAALGDGSLGFSGTTTFPQIKGCFISAILSGLMSGSGQTYKLGVTPPAPVAF